MSCRLTPEESVVYALVERWEAAVDTRGNRKVAKLMAELAVDTLVSLGWTPPSEPGVMSDADLEGKLYDANARADELRRDVERLMAASANERKAMEAEQRTTRVCSTPEQRAEWNRLEKMATPGPWKQHDSDGQWHDLLRCGFDIRKTHMRGDYFATGPRTETAEQAARDSRFIAVSRTAVPILLAERELNAKLVIRGDAEINALRAALVALITAARSSVPICQCPLHGALLNAVEAAQKLVEP